jgi:tetratricopeptide (TPR) repeat protein
MRRSLMGLLVILCYFGGNAQAQTAGDKAFAEGVNLFKKADFRAALERFVAAKEAGLDEPKLDFNLGVCYYKLGEYEPAREAFLHASSYRPMRDLAHFNIGLVESARNRTDEAMRWYQRVFDETDNEKLKALAAAKLPPADQTGMDGREPPSRFGGYFFSLGYDDNIEDPTQLGVAGKGDSFVNLLLYGDALLQGSYGSGLRFSANAYFIRYQDISAYDMDLLQLNLRKTFRSGLWQDTAGIGVEQTTLGGADFLRTAKLELEGEKMLSASDNLDLRYRYSDIVSLNRLYDKLEGNRHEAELRWERKSGGRRYRLGYEFELNDRSDFRGTTIFNSYSPVRHTLELRAYLIPALGWDVDGRLSLRRSTYVDDNILLDGSRIGREDDRVLAGAKVYRTLRGSLKLSLEYKYTDNNSNLTAYDYTRNLYSLGLYGAF